MEVLIILNIQFWSLVFTIMFLETDHYNLLYNEKTLNFPRLSRLEFVNNLSHFSKSSMVWFTRWVTELYCTERVNVTVLVEMIQLLSEKRKKVNHNMTWFEIFILWPFLTWNCPCVLASVDQFLRKTHDELFVWYTSWISIIAFNFTEVPRMTSMKPFLDT